LNVGPTALVLVAVLRSGNAVGDEASCDRPPVTLVRYEEDYSFLRDPRCRTDVWDPLKYLELDRQRPVFLTLGVDVRERYEYFRNLDWSGDRSGRVGYLIQRVMPYADLHVGGHFRGFFQLTSNLVWGRDPRPLDRDDLDLLQAFAQLTFGSFSIRGGRQEIQYASSRLVSIREGPNVRLAFDGVRVMQHVGEWQIDGFGLVPVRVSPGVFDDGPEPGQRFWGVYATGPILSRLIGIDAYYLGLLRPTASFNERTARELRHTIGTRIWGEPGSFDYNLELVYQTGSFGPGTISAWMVASDTGYTIKQVPTQPRVGLQVNAVSGDNDPLDSDLQTFNPMFPRGSYFSQANLIGPLNLVDMHPALTLKPIEDLAITLDWDFFWRESLGDGLYAPSTALQVPGAGNPARYVGSQGAVLVEWRATRHLGLGATYSRLFAGPFLDAAGLGNDVDFVGLWISLAI
jgi:hypothetical protein